MRVEFRLDEFIRTLTEHGYDARWSKAVMCPNRDPYQHDHHKINCDYCDTAGWIYYDPLEIKCLVTSFSTRQVLNVEGRYQPGTAYFTTLPDHKISFWDKIELLNSEARYTEVLPRRSNPHKPKYPVVEVYQVRTSENVEIDPSAVTIDSDGFLILPSYVGAFVALSYVYRPVYIILDLLHQIRDSRVTEEGLDKQVDFPHQGMGRLDFLVRDESAD